MRFGYKIFLILFCFQTAILSSESLNAVLAIINNHSITQADFDEAQEKYRIISRFAPPSRKKSSFHSQVLDFLIDRELVKIAADELLIKVNEKRIESEVERRMEAEGITNIENFKKNIQQKTGMPYEMWREDLKYQIMKAQVISLKVTPQLPSETEIKTWYEKNKAKVGMEFRYREIVLVPANNSIDEETRVYQDLVEIRSKVAKDPSLFKLIASSPRNDSRFRSQAGLVSWTPAFELFKQSRILAGVLAQTPMDRVSEVFRDERKRYAIVLMEGSRSTPLESIRKAVQNILYREKEESAFDSWLEQERKVHTITIYDPVYAKENNIKNPVETFNND